MLPFAMIAIGTLVHGRYRITRPIGRGGMGAVYEAVDARLQNAVALKQMIVEGTEADHAFEQEATLLAALRHPALPVVIDYFGDADGQFLVMQYIEGEDLARALERIGGPCDPDEVRAWACAVLDALRYLHDHQPPIVHRDIKPANLKRTPAGEIVLLDFGLAKGARGASTQASQDRSLYGFTLRYAPPEQIEWSGTDARSDLYALGATLFHLLTGVQPPTSLERATALLAGRADPLKAPRTLNPQVDETFSHVIVRAMALAPADRYASATDMRAALERPRAAGGIRRSQAPRARVRAPRRVDAAMPSQAEVGRQTDLLVQVRFAGSPVLGLEDWPTRRRPPRIEQASEPLQVVHPTDPETGAPLPARLRVRIIAPDFTIEGQSDVLVDVPPDDYSKRLAFLLTPKRAGYCRVNVEVYGLDAVCLGTIPVETEAIGGAVPERTLQAATLVLGVIARQVAEAVQRGETIDLAALAPLLAGQGPAEPGRGAAPPLPSTPAIADDEATRPLAGPGPPWQGPAAAPSVDDTEDTVRLGPPAAAPQASRRPPTGARPVPSIAPTPAPPALPAPQRSAPWVQRLARATPLAAAAVITGVFVWNYGLMGPRRGAPPDQTSPGPVATSPPVAMAPPTPLPAPGPAGETTSPAPPVAATIPAPSATRPGQPRSVWSTVRSSRPGVTLDAQVVDRGAGRVRLALRFVNESAAPARVTIDRDATSLTAGGRRARVVMDSAGTAAGGVFSEELGVAATLRYWMEFELREGRAEVFEVVLAGATGDRNGVGWPPFTLARGPK
jgi:hypothetical protein